MSRVWRICISRRAERDIARLDPTIRRRIHQALKDLELNPLKNVRKLSGPELGGFRLRVGDWRIIFDLEGADIVVLMVGHRREIYRR